MITQRLGFTVHYRQGTVDEEVLKESFENDIFLSETPEYIPDPAKKY